MSFASKRLMYGISIRPKVFEAFTTMGPGPDNFFKIAMSSNGQYITATRANFSNLYKLYRSKNSGDTWTEVSPSIAGYDIAIAASNGLLQTAVDYNNGYIYTTTNAWDSYATVTSAGIADWGCVKMSSNGQIRVAGSWDGKIVVSTDSGATWLSKVVPNFAYYNMGCSSDGQKMIAGGWSSGGVIISTDAGNTWSTIAQFNGYDVRSVTVSPDGSTFYVYSYNQSSLINKSTDNGVTWTNISAAAQLDLSTSLDGKTILTAGAGVSYNYGATFKGWAGFGIFNSIRGVAINSSGDKAVVCAAGGSMYKSFMS